MKLELVEILTRQNELSRLPVVGDHGPVVSLTSHRARLGTLHIMLESIAWGRLLPSRLVIWLDHSEIKLGLSPAIMRLVDRGLEVRGTNDYGPHTKYYPYIADVHPSSCPLVLADDDVIYPPSWLAGLVNEFAKSPDCLCCYRARTVQIAGCTLLPYNTWPLCRSSLPSILTFATAVSGTILPERLVQQLKRSGDGFSSCCPEADDIWIHANAVRADIQTRQIDNVASTFPSVPGTWVSALYPRNFLQGGNDKQAKQTYNAHDLASLARACLAGPCS